MLYQNRSEKSEKQKLLISISNHGKVFLWATLFDWWLDLILWNYCIFLSKGFLPNHWAIWFVDIFGRSEVWPLDMLKPEAVKSVQSMHNTFLLQNVQPQMSWCQKSTNKYLVDLLEIRNLHVRPSCGVRIPSIWNHLRCLERSVYTATLTDLCNFWVIPIPCQDSG